MKHKYSFKYFGKYEDIDSFMKIQLKNYKPEKTKLFSSLLAAE